jgi:hypothetical protein
VREVAAVVVVIEYVIDALSMHHHYISFSIVMMMLMVVPKRDHVRYSEVYIVVDNYCSMDDGDDSKTNYVQMGLVVVVVVVVNFVVVEID